MVDDHHHPKRDEKACACFYEGDGDWLCCVHCNTLFGYDARVREAEERAEEAGAHVTHLTEQVNALRAELDERATKGDTP